MDVVKCARLHRLHSGFIVLHRSNEYDCRLGRYFAGMPQHINAIGIWHFDVGYQHVISCTLEFSLRRLAAIDCFNAVALFTQRYLQHLANGANVIADQNVSHGSPQVCEG